MRPVQYCNNQCVLSVVGIDTEGGDQPLTVGVMHTITCRTSLNISDIVWIDDMDTIVASNSEGVQQLDLVFNPINDSIHDRMYTCTITTLVNLVISETVNITVTGKQLSIVLVRMYWYVNCFLVVL